MVSVPDFGTRGPGFDSCLRQNIPNDCTVLCCTELCRLLDMTLRLALWVKFSADDILKYFSYFSQKTGFDISCKLSPKETICMKCQILFSVKNEKNNIILSSAENAQRVVKVK